MKTNPRLLLALALAGSLSACGSKDKTADQTAQTAAPATMPTDAAAPAAAPAAATTPAAATFDIATVPISTAALGAFPYVGRLQGYKINVPSDSVDFEFDRQYAYDGHNLVPVEGHVLRREYVAVNDQKKTSVLMMQRNYESLIKALGGVKVSSGNLPSEAVERLGDGEYNKHSGNMAAGYQADTYVIHQKDKEIWVQLRPDDYRYYLNVTEKAVMPQRVSTTAAELKKN